MLSYPWFWMGFGAVFDLLNQSKTKDMRAFFEKILKKSKIFEVNNDKNFRKLFFHHKLQVFLCGRGPSAVVIGCSAAADP